MAGGIWGLSSSDVYVPVGNASGSRVAHWNGAAWSLETLPGDPFTGTAVLWGTSDTDLWMAGVDTVTFGSYLAHRGAGGWALDANAPSSYGLNGLWGADANTVYVIGRDRATENFSVWKRSGAAWVSQVLPALPVPGHTAGVNIWGSDAAHVRVAANQVNDDGSPAAGIVLTFDGAAWSQAPVPADLVRLHWLQGASATDAFATGLKADGTYAAYRVSGASLTLWGALGAGTATYQGPLVSPSTGNAVIGAWATPDSLAGTGRLSLVQSAVLSAPRTIDPLAFLPQSVWKAPGSNATYLDHYTILRQDTGTYTGAGFYKGTCQ